MGWSLGSHKIDLLFPERGQKEKKKINGKCKKQHEGIEIWECISYC